MKLINKKTGEIRPAEAREDGVYLYDETTKQWYKFELSLLAEGWEYYEETKAYWCVDSVGDTIQDQIDHGWIDEHREQIGNYFGSEEEARRAVEKLKAWRRLKDKGFRFKDYTRKFDGFERVDGSVLITAELDDEGVIGMIDELNLLFRGEE